MNDDGSQLGETVCETLCGVVVQAAAGAVGPEHERFAAGSAVLALGGDGLAFVHDLKGAVYILVGVGAVGVLLWLAVLLLLLLAVLRLLLV